VTRYRIIGNGEVYKVQVARWWGWADAQEGYGYDRTTVAPFRSLEAAEFFVEKQLSDEELRNRKWVTLREL
jgi:hypothetical protein